MFSKLFGKKDKPKQSPQELMATSYNSLISKLEVFVRNKIEAKEIATHLYNDGVSNYIESHFNQGIKKTIDDINLDYLPERTGQFISRLKQQQKDLFAGKIDFDDLIKDSVSLDFDIVNKFIKESLGDIDDHEIKLGITLAVINKLVHDWEL
ncbi:hypothetical protein ACUY4R_004406 [Kosakonia sp. BK9b]